MHSPVNPNTESPTAAAIGALLGDNALPRLETSLLIAHVLGRARESVLAHPEWALDLSGLARFIDLRAQRLRGMPMHYLLGWREFYGLRLRLTPEVLIPRPETEGVVDCALELLPIDEDRRVLDLGTGSGAIALAIARCRPRASVVATDVSGAALALASANAVSLAIGNVAFRQGDWFAAVGNERYDLVVGNPPYVAEHDPHLTEGDVRHEPRLALVAGADGFSELQRILGQATPHLLPGGWLILEHGFDQAERLRRHLDESGFVGISTRRDLSGNERVTLGQISD